MNQRTRAGLISMSRHTLSFFILTTLLLAGCTNAPTSSVSEANHQSPASGSAPQATPPSAASVSSNPGATPTMKWVNSSGKSQAQYVGVSPDANSFVGVSQWDDGKFSVSANATSLRIVVTWSALSPTASQLRISLVEGERPVADKTGASPVEITLPSLASGSYAVHVFPTPPASVMPEQEVDWTASYQTQG